MQLYFRDEQLNRLDEIFDSTSKGSNFVLLTGKRRVGKTTLAREHLHRRRGAYISISIKASALQLNDISDYLKSFEFTNDFIPGFRSWEEFFQFIFHISREKSVNLVIDEFHNLGQIEPEFISAFKNLWDKYAPGSKLNLIVISNSELFVRTTFYDAGSPLYRIVTHNVDIKPFTFSEVLNIAKLHSSLMKFDDLKKLYLIFGGLPKFYYLIQQAGLWKSSPEMILRELVFRKYAPLSYELNELLATELGRGNKIPLSILQMIALGKNTVSEIAASVSIPVTSTGKYLGELEKHKALIKRKVPLGTADPARSKNGKYVFRNYFDNFWFRFIQPDLISYELGEYDKMLKRIMEELDDYLLERYPLVLKEILRERRRNPEIRRITGSEDVLIDMFWTRRVSFDLALLDEKNSQLKLCRIFAHEQRAAEKDIVQLKTDLAEVERAYPQFKSEIVILSEREPSANLISILPSAVKIFRLDHLENILKSGHTVRVAPAVKPKPHRIKSMFRPTVKKLTVHT